MSEVFSKIDQLAVSAGERVGLPGFLYGKSMWMIYELKLEDVKPRYEKVVLLVLDADTKDTQQIPMWERGKDNGPVRFKLQRGKRYTLCLEYMDESNKAVFGMSCMLKAGDEPNGFMAKAVLVGDQSDEIQQVHSIPDSQSD